MFDPVKFLDDEIERIRGDQIDFGNVERRALELLGEVRDRMAAALGGSTTSQGDATQQ